MIGAESISSVDVLSALGNQAQASRAGNTIKIDKAAEDFEAMFATQILAPMMQSVEVNETFGGGAGEEMFRGMLMQEYGKAAARGGSFGLAQHVRTELLKTQEHS